MISVNDINELSWQLLNMLKETSNTELHVYSS